MQNMSFHLQRWEIVGPKQSIKITDHCTCTSAIVIYCITCTLYKKLYIGETGRRLGDRFREHLRDVEKDDKRELKHARFWDTNGNRKWVNFTFNLPSHNHIHIAKYLFSIRDE